MSEIKPGDVETLLELFEASDWRELKLKVDGLELYVSKTPGARATAFAEPAAALAPAPVAAAQTASAAPAKGAVSGAPDHWATVRAPNLGTFYRAPKPGAPPFVKVGQQVEPTTEVCLIEVMKLFTTVFAGVSGTVRQILVEDTELVEFDQALVLIEPDA